MKRTPAILAAITSVFLLAACSADEQPAASENQQAGGNAGSHAGAAGDSSGASGASGNAGAAGTGGAAGTSGTSGASGAGNAGTGGTEPQGPQLVIQKLELAQTHVLPETGLSWTLGDEQRTLHLVGGRACLALVNLGGTIPTHPRLEAQVNGVVQGSVELLAPSALPATEAGGPSYAPSSYSANLDGAWVKTGLSLRVTSEDHASSEYHPLEVGLDSEFNMYTLPFYLFGANDSNSATIAETAKPDAASEGELYQKWAISTVHFSQHPAGRIDWPYIIVGPRDGAAAERVNNKDEQNDGYAVMDAVLDTLSAIRSANGESETNNHYYAPLLMLNSSGEYEHPGGGLGGGSLGTGDYAYAGIFIHEQGHAFGMPHAGEAFDSGEFPYAGGSLLGSVWGYDADRHEFLAPFMIPGSEQSNECLADPDRQVDSMGRCMKQDPMQGGSGDQTEGYKYTYFSDFNASVIQRYFEGQTAFDDEGARVYIGGAIIVDTASSTGYSRWDTLDHKRVEVTPSTEENALYGFDQGLPSQRGVPVHTIVFTLSHAGTPGASQIYPPLSYTGNLRRQVDPTSQTQLDQIIPNTSDNPWYCHASGCDYTLRVTYTDDTKTHVLVRGGFRPWFGPEDPGEDSTDDPTNGNSFQVFGINVPGDKPISKIEVLSTPMGWNGLPSNPTVLLSRP